MRRAALALALLAAAGLAARAQVATLCAEVKLEILQEATLEREAFDASLKVNNNLPDTPLTNLRVTILIKDEAGAPADPLFFVKLSSLTNTNAIDGSGVVQSSSTAEVRWLIIPSTGAGGALPAGRRYSVRATISGLSGAVPQAVTTFDDFITVKPQPSLRLQYVLPFEVFGDEPLTQEIEPVEPFALGVRLVNAGYGTARDFKIDSAQPKIVENKQGLDVDFKLLGTVVSGRTVPNSLLIPFGDVPPGGAVQASWLMSTTLSGRFVSFQSSFTHAAELGGQLTSLLESVTTYTLVKEVRVALPGRDEVPDFLVDTRTPRSELKALLDSGRAPPADLILESDQPEPIPVASRDGTISGPLGGGSASLVFGLSQVVAPGLWVYASAPFPDGERARLVSAVSADGRLLDARNAWVSKHADQGVVSYRLNLLDLASGATAYVFTFDPATVDMAPGAVTDLVAATGETGGSLALSWTAPGEDGDSGAILGGRYLIASSLDPAGPFVPESAQVRFATSTFPGRAESRLVESFIGNATHFLALWTQDTGGSFSALSNAATAYARPYPPSGALFDLVGSSLASGAVQLGNNALPIQYQVSLSSGPSTPALAQSPFLDPVPARFSFETLSPNATYYLSGLSRNPDTGVLSAQASLGAFMTLAEPPGAAPFLAVSSQEATAQWTAAGNPAGTQYRAQLSTSADFSPVFLDGGWTLALSQPFTGLAAYTTYYARAQARNAQGVETAHTNLGSFITLPPAPAPVTDLAATAFRSDDPASGAVALSWSFPEDSARLDLRYSSTTGSFEAMERQVSLSTAGAPGEARSLLISGLERGASWTFALRYGRALGEFSLPSNAASARTLEALSYGSVALTTTTLFLEAAQTSTLTVAALGAEQLDAVARGALLDSELRLAGAAFAIGPAGSLDARLRLSWPALFQTVESSLTLRAFSGGQWSPVSGASWDLGADAVEWNASGLPLLVALTLPDPQPLSLFSITPASAENGGDAAVAVDGSGFRAGASLALSRPGGAWTAAASMAQARLTHAAFRLPSGKILVTGGGTGGSTPTRVTELYDPATGLWTPTGQLATARYAPAYAQLPDGRVMIFGGFIDSGGFTVHATAELYDPATGLWSPAGVLPNGRWQAALTALADGRVLLAGGRGTSGDYDDSFLYNPVSNSWTPAGRMSHRRGVSRAVRLNDGRVIVVGGVDNNGSNSSDIYDPATGVWTQGPNLNQGRYSHTATLLADGRVLVTGGTSAGALASAELYDPAANRWTLTPPMPQARVFHSAERLADGRVFLFGDGSSPSSVYYDPVANAWTPGPNLSMARSNLAGAVLADGRVLAIGGWGNGRTQETVEVLGSERIAAQGVSVVNARRLTGVLPLAGKPSGRWNVVVANTDGASASLPNGFEVIVPPPPSLESVFPSSGVNTGTMTVTLMGANFRSGASFLILMGSSFVDASSVTFISSVSLSGILDLTGAPEGLWTVQVANPDGQEGNLPDAFLVYPPDLTPPALSAAEVSADGLVWASTATTVIRSTPAWARVVVADAGVGLIGPDGVPAPSARFTSDGGASWDSVDASSLSWTLAADATPGRGPYLFAAAGLPLALTAPVGSNRVEWTVSDAAGNVAVATTTILAAPPLPPPPVIASVWPDWADDSGPVTVTVQGSGFQEGAALALSRAGLGPWTSVASMAQPRLTHGAFLLPSGKALVAGGGAGGDSPTAAVELFDPATNSWSQTGSLSVGRYAASYAQLPDGRVLIVGGFIGGTIHATAELYDPASGVWSPAGALPNARFQAAVTALADGRVLLAGGRGAGADYQDSFLYDPALGVWTAAGTMSHRRGASRSVRLNDGRVLVVGGVDNNGSNSSDLYDPATGLWTQGPYLNQGRYSHTATLLADGRVLVTGGTSNGALDSAEVYDPAANVWTLTPPMPQPRVFHSAERLSDGRVLLFGDSSSASSVYYDPVANSWSAGPDLALARSNLAGVTLPDGRVLALGGWADGRTQETVEALSAQRIPASGVVVTSAENLSGTLDLTGKATGYWSLSVTNPDGRSASRAQGFEILPRVLLEPTTGPIGTAFVIRGAGLGAPGEASRVLFGAVPAPVSSWTDSEVAGTVPGLSSGAYAVTVEGGPRARLAGHFTVLLPEIASVTPAAAKAGSTLTVSGTAFGAYAEGLERLRVGLSTAAVGSWTDGEISAILAPDAAEGRQAVWVERASLDGGLALSATASVLLDFTAPSSTLAALTESLVSAETIYAATTSWRVSAYDPAPAGEASGVASLRLSLDGGAFAEAADLTLAEGAHDLSFLAADAAGNFESTRTARVVVDLTPPAPLADLAAVDITTYSVRLAWTQTDADAAELLVEYSSGAAPARLVLPLAGRTTLLVEGLSVASDYSFALWTRDLVGNLSSVSTAAARTLALAASPDGVATLVSPEAAITVVPTTTAEQPGAYTIATSSQGLKLLTTTFYELSGGPVEFSTPAVLTFIFDPTGVDLGQVAIYRWNGVYWDSAPVSGQELTLLADGTYQITGLLGHTSLYGVFERLDVRAPRTTLAVTGPQAPGVAVVYVSSAASLTLTSVDDLLEGGDGLGLGTAVQEAAYDGATLSFVNPAPAKGAVFASSFRLSGADGVYVVTYQARDLFGNLEGATTAAFALDQTPPVSALGIGQPQAPFGDAVLVSSATPLWVDAVDPEQGFIASGASWTAHAVDGGAYASAQPFALGGPEGPRTVSFFAEDRVGNASAPLSRNLVVDSLPPALALEAGGAGLGSVVSGVVELRGSVADAHLGAYRLEAAPGQGAVQGFVLLSSGTESISGVLALWDASLLSGWYTLRLSAGDLVGNGATLSASVFVGEPARLLVLGDHKTFTMPEAVAAGPDGLIYVADTGADRVLVFNSTGALLSAFSGFSKPRGVAVDAAGNVFVADTGRGRVVKLSPAGEVLLQMGGKEEGEKKDKDEGKGKRKEKSLLKRPAGIALGPDGSIVVADAGHRRLEVFNSTGGALLSVPLPPGPEDDEDEPRPWGVAVDAAGRLYASDPPGGRALVFAADGTLLRELAIPAQGDKEPRPHGIAVSPSGDALFVSERQSGRILRFDAEGRLTLSFGAHGKIRDGKPLPEALVFNKPMGLALLGGTLLVADRNNDRVQQLSVPTGEPALLIPPQVAGGEEAVDVLDTEEGGSVARGDKAGVAVPAGALKTDTKISVAAASAADENARRGKAEDAGLKPVSAPVEFSPHGTEFDKPVTLTLPYSPELVAAQAADAKALAVAYWNDKTKAWEPLESEVDAHNKTVSAKTRHFSLYQVVGSTGGGLGLAAAPAADESFAFRDLYVYPNPARGGAVPKLHLAVGVADKVSLRVFDAAGREVHRATLEGRPAVIDDGSGAKYAYEHAWEGRIPSGVYLFVVEAEKAGAAPIRKAGRFGVVR